MLHSWKIQCQVGQKAEPPDPVDHVLTYCGGIVLNNLPFQPKIFYDLFPTQKKSVKAIFFSFTKTVIMNVVQLLSEVLNRLNKQKKDT